MGISRFVSSLFSDPIGCQKNRHIIFVVDALGACQFYFGGTIIKAEV